MVGSYECDSGSSGSTKYVVPEGAQYIRVSLHVPSTGPQQMASAI
jgi:hypothetical protein